MNLFTSRLARLALVPSLGLLSLAGVLSPTHAQGDVDPILNADATAAWSWHWEPATGYTKQDCSGGDGQVVMSLNGDTAQGQPADRPIAFHGTLNRPDGTTTPLDNSGTWSYVGIEPNTQQRTYDLHWSASTDHLFLSPDGSTLDGLSGNCHVTGTRL